MNFETISNAVVQINTASGSGTGFYVKKANLVATNYHVISGHKSVSVETHDKNKYAAKVVMINPRLDLALLKLSKDLELPDVIFQSSKTLKPMDKVAVLGYPLGLPFTVTEGIVSAVEQLLNGQKYIQTDSAVNPGNSGGPLINSDGAIIGIATSKFTEADNMAYALPVDLLLEQLDTYKENPNNDVAVKCPSCDHNLFEKIEFCPNCGSTLDVKKLFVEKELSPLTKFCEGVIQELGIDPVIARTGPDFWEFHKGSAFIRIFIYNNSYLFATCPLAKLPKTNLIDIYKYILSDQFDPFTIGLHSGTVYLSYRVHLADLMNESQKPKIQKNFEAMILKADELDNYLVEKMGCEWSELSKK